MDYLKKIAAYKQEEVANLLRKKKRFSAALKKFAVIGEVKRRSPSRGVIGEIDDPVALAKKYIQGGAGAISVLTDGPSFGGCLEDLQRVSAGIEAPTLRKDFILHPLQLAEAATAGASAVLLIARLVGKELKSLMTTAELLGLETLTEIHDEEDLQLALEAGAPIIGVNHRNLETFAIDLSISDRLKPLIPAGVITVAESGIHTPEQAKRMRELGYDAILVGEALVKAENPARLIAAMRGVQVKICGVTHPEDAFYAASKDADYIGIIFAKSSKRYVDPAQAELIAKEAKRGGAEPVAVFADATTEEILAVCKRTGIATVQIYGNTKVPEGLTKLEVIDGENPGSGKPFDWNAFTPPKNTAYFLAGGLTPGNVADAIRLLKPFGVDVASGVEKPGTTRKELELVAAFIRAAKEAL